MGKDINRREAVKKTAAASAILSAPPIRIK